MKILMKPIRMICFFEENGIPNPIKFQYRDEEKKYITVKVDNIVNRDEEKLAGNRMFIFKCQSEDGDVIKIYELKYEINTCKWFLFKM